ncbi:uncharacterized protein LOC128983048 [Macrosteles quadrilineatus]|uniref:uncharacterized protein LOC128983048 n=1 Tax=Macrosteles quadrilineatus TaxID=74068 RepID=UPI0023E2DA9D|nr:uncharacterized protein LOC128983048 [Macrosteles quadrilineatus]
MIRDDSKNHRFPEEMARPVKGGYLLRHKKRLFGRAWREEWVVLYDDSTLAWFKEKGRGEPEGSVVVKEAPEMLAVSQWTLRIPGRPVLPSGCHVVQLMAFGTRGGDKVHWLLAQSEEEVNHWMTAISNTLPPPPQTQTDNKSNHDCLDSQPQRLSPTTVQITNGDSPAITKKDVVDCGCSDGGVGGGGVGTTLLLWGQGLGWSWTYPSPNRCTANHHCCCCDAAPQPHDVSHNQCCGCDATSNHQAPPPPPPSTTCVDHHHLHHHDVNLHHLYDTCNYAMDDVDYSMDCSGDFGF